MKNESKTDCLSVAYHFHSVYCIPIGFYIGCFFGRETTHTYLCHCTGFSDLLFICYPFWERHSIAWKVQKNGKSIIGEIAMKGLSRPSIYSYWRLGTRYCFHRTPFVNRPAFMFCSNLFGHSIHRHALTLIGFTGWMVLNGMLKVINECLRLL